MLSLAAGALAAVGVPSSASAATQPQTVRLDGAVSGWVGRAPDAIAGETNPTLRLEPGRRYRLVWTNVDGQPHNVALLDGSGEVLERTAFVTEQDTVQVFEFTARDALAEYVCEAHPGSMRGNVRTGDEPREGASDEQGGRFMPWGPTVETETVADGPLSAPLALEVAPNERDRRFILDQIGKIYVHGPDGLDEEPFLDIADRLVDFGGAEAEGIDERGLLGIAFHPRFAANRRFFVRYSAPATPRTPKWATHVERLAEFRASRDRLRGRPDSERVVLDIPSPYHTHNAGSVVFGPDGYLYVGMGDGGGSKREAGHADDWYANNGGNGQNVTDNLLGSILRLDVDRREDGKPYAIPEDNPLVGRDGLDEHFAWGFRNPWRMSFDGGRLFVADVGESNYEEVNVVERGGNYGWNVREGTHCYSTDSPETPSKDCPRRTPPNVRGGEALLDPILEYPHVYEGEGVGLAVIGGHVYDGSIPGLDGDYVFGDYSKDGTPRGSLFAATPTEGDGWSLAELRVAGTDGNGLGAYLLGIGRDAEGELYALTTGVLGVDASTTTGAVHKLLPEEAATDSPQTGGESAAEGPGFGALAALAGLAAGLARALSGTERE